MGPAKVESFPYQDAACVATSDYTFFDAIDKPSLKNILTPKHPWVITCMGTYLQDLGLRDSGGLEILMGDMILQANKLGIPFIGLTLAYPYRSKPRLDENFYQIDTPEFSTPKNRGMVEIGKTKIRANGDVVDLDVYKAGDFPLYGLYEPGLGSLYSGTPSCDHRMYQQAVLGFGGYQVIKDKGVSPAIWHLNESSATFMPMAVFDGYFQRGNFLRDAERLTRENTILTNHTLVSAAVGCLSKKQYDDYVAKNLSSKTVELRLRQIMARQKDVCNLSVYSTTLAGRSNGVSKLHASLADGQFMRADGTPVKFDPVTNGVFMGRWIHPDLLNLYRNNQLIDKFDLPTENYAGKINHLSSGELMAIKDQVRSELIDHLRGRVDQYGQQIDNIPNDAKLACWTKRFVGYKRPGMLFEDVGELKDILDQENIHILLSGKTHPEDGPSKLELQRILRLVDQDEGLRQRVHYIQDYDEDLARKLVSGVDIWFNTPEVGKEACGTSWMKAVGNLAILISTEDGGVADAPSKFYLKINYGSYQDEVGSLYQQFREATRIIGNDGIKGWFVKNQLVGFLPIISGGRMWKDYLNFAYPRMN